MNNFIDDEPKYRKKSKAKGQPRSKHKHIYEVVLLTRYFTIPDRQGNPKMCSAVAPYRVCTVCGRIDDMLFDDEYYIGVPRRYPRELSEKALALPKWHCNKYFDKFAVKTE
jgi:hypothetical protein